MLLGFTTQGGKPHTKFEQAEHLASPQVGKLHPPLGRLPHTPPIFSRKQHEQYQREDLKGQTSNHDIGARLAARTRVRCGGDGAADGLEEE